MSKFPNNAPGFDNDGFRIPTNPQKLGQGLRSLQTSQNVSGLSSPVSPRILEDDKPQSKTNAEIFHQFLHQAPMTNPYSKRFLVDVFSSLKNARRKLESRNSVKGMNITLPNIYKNGISTCSASKQELQGSKHVLFIRYGTSRDMDVALQKQRPNGLGNDIFIKLEPDMYPVPYDIDYRLRYPISTVENLGSDTKKQILDIERAFRQKIEKQDFFDADLREKLVSLDGKRFYAFTARCCDQFGEISHKGCISLLVGKQLQTAVATKNNFLVWDEGITSTLDNFVRDKITNFKYVEDITALIDVGNDDILFIGETDVPVLLILSEMGIRPRAFLSQKIIERTDYDELEGRYNSLEVQILKSQYARYELKGEYVPDFCNYSLYIRWEFQEAWAEADPLYEKADRDDRASASAIQ
ncbi:hypothetical protein BS50DRAFT_588523 [Corynespora cassiicola Philippines]|uniref:Uncharacterized protein n=1 Tax=Corynespora cassiicola Philippines TaxID=1448308 RepID=A0A2T2NJT4_CORCC|nr:hypothetical protein BS50DRAFT_588523 [Corynespora cassiicola Philippines]